MSHILTSDVHKNLENKLRSVISEHNKRTGLLKQVTIAPKPQSGLSRPPNSSALHTTTSSKPPWPHLTLPQNTPSLSMVQPVTLAQPVTSAHVQPRVGVPGSSWSLTHSLSNTTQSHVAFVSSPLPVSQTSLTLQPSVPSTVIFSGRASPNKPVDVLVSISVCCGKTLTKISLGSKGFVWLPDHNPSLKEAKAGTGGRELIQRPGTGLLLSACPVCSLYKPGPQWAGPSHIENSP